MERKEIKTQICIVGAGPGGAFLALLLARAGINTVLLEKADDFNRDFRGESLSPDARQLLEDHGLEDFIEHHGYLESRALNLCDNGDSLMRFEFSDYKFKNQCVIEFPQPALLQVLTNKAAEYDNFTFLAKASCKSLIQDDKGAVNGITVKNSDKSEIIIHANLVVAADGRYSKMRSLANLGADIKKAPRDVLWLKVPRPANWPSEVSIKLKKDRHLIVLPTFPDHLRLGVNIPAGQYKSFRKQGIEHLHNFIIDLEPRIEKEVRETITDWSCVALLDIFTARVPRWYVDGMALLGDSAHTITPVMGQGIKHALFDAKKLYEVITDRLAVAPEALIRGKYLESYQKERQEETDFILGIQERQERIFSFASPLKVLLRRTVYRIINNLSGVKKKMVERVYFAGYLKAEADRKSVS
ncbi:FAD-dependent monooxygenase [Teredinibacter purpureus]|uniref:FAD-dependent monooxygenase n=1 Tax=Teredinibacter purpureus TaxID=2731756 RepID=UPI0005F769B0|nr:FAD-dependent monooxygenase [Teredinibacter purpureus]